MVLKRAIRAGCDTGRFDRRQYGIRLKRAQIPRLGYALLVGHASLDDSLILVHAL